MEELVVEEEMEVEEMEEVVGEEVEEVVEEEVFSPSQVRECGCAGSSSHTHKASKCDVCRLRGGRQRAGGSGGVAGGRAAQQRAQMGARTPTAAHAEG